MQEGVYYSKEIEMAVLGICLLEKSAFGRTYGIIDSDSFYFKDHAAIYDVLKDMYDKNIPVDLLTVWQLMCEQDIKLTEDNTSYALTRLTNHVVSSSHLEYHCTVLKKMWRKRELLKITRSGIDMHEDERKEAYKVTEQIQNLLSGEEKQDWFSMDELMYNLMKHQAEIEAGNKKTITTGFRAIDKLNGGFSPGQMIVIGARPSVGKSALMGKIATAIAKNEQKVGIISLEMNNTDIAARLASLETDIEFWKIHRNLFDDQHQQERFYNIITKQSINLPIYVSDKTKVDINEIKAKAIKLKHKHGLDILMVDYLQLVETSTGNKNYNREQEVAKISRGLKLLAMDMQLPIVVLCQLNRNQTGRKGKDRFPQLSDLRESGAIEQDADVVMMLHRDWMSGHEVHPETGNSTEFQADLLGVKWRNGATFHLEIDFDPQKMRFVEQKIPIFSPMPKQTDDSEGDPF